MYTVCNPTAQGTWVSATQNDIYMYYVLQISSHCHPCHQEEEGTPPPPLPMTVSPRNGETIKWDVQSTSLHSDMIQNMAVKLTISWAHDPSHPQILWLEFLQRTENLNTHDNGVLAVDWNWTASTTAMPSNTHSHSSYSLTKHNSNLHR